MKQNAKISNTPHNIDLGKVTAPTATVLSYVLLTEGNRRNPAPPFCFPRLLATVYSFGEDQLDIGGLLSAADNLRTVQCQDDHRLKSRPLNPIKRFQHLLTTRKTPLKMQLVVDLLRHVVFIQFLCANNGRLALLTASIRQRRNMIQGSQCMAKPSTQQSSEAKHKRNSYQKKGQPPGSRGQGIGFTECPHATECSPIFIQLVVNVVEINLLSNSFSDLASAIPGLFWFTTHLRLTRQLQQNHGPFLRR